MSRARLAAALLLLHGCSDADTSGGRPLEVWETREQLRVGSVDRPGDILTRIGSVEEGPDGRVYVAQPEDLRVLVFDSAGRRVGAFGRAGGGPGEFSSLDRMDLRGDTLVIRDPLANRFQLFTLEGEATRTLGPRMPPPDTSHFFSRLPRPLALLPDGSVLASHSLPADLVASGDITEQAYLRIDTAGGVLDTVALMPMGNRQLAFRLPRGPMFSSQRFGDGPLWELAADGSFLALDREVREGEPHFTVTKVRLDGDTLWHREYPYEPVPLPAQEVEDAVTSWSRVIRERGGASAAAAERIVRDALYVPAHRPPVRLLRTAADGGIWLLLAAPDEGTGRWLVLDRGGTPRAHALLPEDATPAWIGPDHLWASETDALDVPYLVRYRLIRPAGVDPGP